MLDTRQKRASAFSIMMMVVLSPPEPDGSLDASDRLHIGWSYAGIAAGAPPTPPAVEEDLTPQVVYLAGARGFKVIT